MSTDNSSAVSYITTDMDSDADPNTTFEHLRITQALFPQLRILYHPCVLFPCDHQAMGPLLWRALTVDGVAKVIPGMAGGGIICYVRALFKQNLWWTWGQ